MNALARPLIVLPVVVVLAWASLIAYRNGAADLLTAGAAKELATWRSADVRDDSWNWVKSDLEEAAALDASDPAIHELLGMLKARRLDSEDYLQQAVVHYKEALRLRPVSPYGWANLADALYRVGQTGAEFELAIRRAAELGGSEPQVQRTIADLGFAVWNETDPEMRGLVERAVDAGLRRNPLEMLQISERRGRLDVTCRQLASIRRTDESKWSKFCESTEATR